MRIRMSDWRKWQARLPYIGGAESGDVDEREARARRSRELWRSTDDHVDRRGRRTQP